LKYSSKKLILTTISLHLERLFWENGKMNDFFDIFRSDEALDLHIMVKKLGNMPEFCAEEYLINFFETLYF
jgi:hypothetical protein